MRHHYRLEQDRFWNQAFLNSMKNYNEETIPAKEDGNKNSDTIENDENNPPIYDVPINVPPDPYDGNGFSIFPNRPGESTSWPSPAVQREELNSFSPNENGPSVIQTSALTATALIVVATIFLLVNVGAFAFIFYQRGKLRVRENLFRNRFRCKTISVPDIFEENENGDIYAIAESHRKVEGRRYGDKKSRIRLKRATKKDKHSMKKDATESDGARVASVKPEAISGKRLRRWPLSRQCSGSTITVVDAQSKVRDWIAQEISHRSPRFLRGSKKRKMGNAVAEARVMDDVEMVTSSKRVGCEKSGPPIKISIGVDATPAARTGSVLKQVPIELTKSLDDGKSPLLTTSMRLATSTSNIRKGVRNDDPNALSGCDESDEYSQRTGTHKSSARIRLKTPEVLIDALPVLHSHSRSDPSPMTGRDDLQHPLYSCVNKRTNRLKSFGDSKNISESFEMAPQYEEINVTSLSDSVDSEVAMYHPTAEETLCSLAKRFPKVLPDISGADRKLNRFSLPMCVSEAADNGGGSSFGAYAYKSASKLGRVPPAPPPRLTSTLGRKPSTGEDENKQFSHITVQLRKVEPVIVEEKCVDILQTESCENVPK